MRFIKAKKGEDAGAVARRAHGAGARDDVRDAERGILDVNPALRKRKLDADELVLVPTAGQGSGRGGHGGKEAASALLEQTKERVEAFREVLEERFEKRGAAARADLDRLKGKDAARLARHTPALKNRVPAAMTRANRTVQRVDEMRTLHRDALEQVTKDLDSLLETFRDVAPGGVPLKAKPVAGRPVVEVPKFDHAAAAPRSGAAPAKPASAPAARAPAPSAPQGSAGGQRRTGSIADSIRAEAEAGEKKSRPAPGGRNPDAHTDRGKGGGPRKK
jgi:hypothetical protein